MEDKYQNKYRIPSTRLAGWDYGSHGLYFITICTKDRVRYFGEIVEKQHSEIGVTKDIRMETRSIASLQKTDIGCIAYDNWLKIPEFHPYVELDKFVIMPDHMHGILFINKPDKINWEVNKFGTQTQNIASIIRGYKSSVTQFATLNEIDLLWQSRYFDRVIRDEKEYLNIAQYIEDNPEQWLLNNDDTEKFFKS